MLCERCKKKKASIFYEETINGSSRSYSLCGDCAKELEKSGEITMNHNLSGLFFDHAPFGGISDPLFGSLFGLPESPRTSKRVCPLCHSDFESLQKSGKVGCPVCYETFNAELRPSLRSIHGNLKHVGRSPARFKKQREQKTRLEELRASLEAAIAEENFETAAKLRDEIRALENTAEGGK